MLALKFGYPGKNSCLKLPSQRFIDMSSPRLTYLTAITLVLTVALILSGCSGSSNTPMNSSMGAINVMVSDPATCSAPQGQFSHIFVTITDVEINSSASAGSNDSG